MAAVVEIAVVDRSRRCEMEGASKPRRSHCLAEELRPATQIETGLGSGRNDHQLLLHNSSG
jgi:hypothetical protein